MTEAILVSIIFLQELYILSLIYRGAYMRERLRLIQSKEVFEVTKKTTDHIFPL